MKKKASTILFALLVLMSSTAAAHGGKTDGLGGHNDNKNKSGLGSYHYHCGGNPAHLHSNGVCPFGGSTGSTNGGSSGSSGGNSGGTKATPKPTAKPTEKPIQDYDFFEGEEYAIGITMASNVNFRKSPSKKAEIVDKTGPKGMAFLITEGVQTASDGYWYCFIHKGKEVYISSEFVSIIPEDEAEEYTVWITTNGSKYHTNRDCGNMSNPEYMYLDEALWYGYEPCDRCKAYF